MTLTARQACSARRELRTVQRKLAIAMQGSRIVQARIAKLDERQRSLTIDLWLYDHEIARCPPAQLTNTQADSIIANLPRAVRG